MRFWFLSHLSGSQCHPYLPVDMLSSFFSCFSVTHSILYLFTGNPCAVPLSLRLSPFGVVPTAHWRLGRFRAVPLSHASYADGFASVPGHATPLFCVLPLSYKPICFNFSCEPCNSILCVIELILEYKV